VQLYQPGSSEYYVDNGDDDNGDDDNGDDDNTASCSYYSTLG
jgi:hypothetical protein